MKGICCYSAIALTVLLSGCIVVPPRQQVAVPQPQVQPEPPPQAQPEPTLGVEDVKALAKAGLSDELIISQIRSSGTVYHLNAADIILLKNAGVGEKVIACMINTPSTAVSPPTAAVQPPPAVMQPPPAVAPQPVVVQQPVMVAEPVMVPESYVWDGYEFVGFVGNQYFYLGAGNVWLVAEPFRLERFHGWERGHSDWRMHAIRNEQFRGDRNGHVQPRHEPRKDEPRKGDRDAH
jgi:hypothetical protein